MFRQDLPLRGIEIEIPVIAEVVQGTTLERVIRGVKQSDLCLVLVGRQYQEHVLENRPARLQEMLGQANDHFVWLESPVSDVKQ